MNILINKLKVSYLYTRLLTFFIFLSLTQTSTLQHDTIKANQILENVKNKIDNLPNDKTDVQQLERAANTFIKYNEYQKVYDCIYALYRIGSKQNDYKNVLTKIMEITLRVPSSFVKIKADAEFIIGYIFVEQGDIHFGLSKYQNLLKPYEGLKDTIKLGKVYLNTGIISITLRDYKTAILRLEKAVSLLQNQDKFIVKPTYLRIKKI